MLPHIPPPGEFSWTDWHWEPSILIGLLLFEGAYLLGVGPLRRRRGWADRVEPTQITAFSLGVLVIFLALQSPLDELSDGYLFSAHMVQHLLLIMVMPPLLLLGTPGWLLRPLLRFSLVARLGRALTRPLVAFVLFNTVFSLAHLPAFYELALREQGVHILMHLAFMATAVVLWWPVLSPLPELPRLVYPARMLYLFLQTIPGSLVGALITLAEEVLYPTYAAAPRVWDISALADQQIGGLIMWVGDGLFFLLAISIVFFLWANREDSPEPGIQTHGPNAHSPS